MAKFTVSQLTVATNVSAPVAANRVTSTDALEQIRKLGELRDAGLVTDEEFESKKAELLRRV